MGTLKYIFLESFIAKSENHIPIPACTYVIYTLSNNTQFTELIMPELKETHLESAISNSFN